MHTYKAIYRSGVQFLNESEGIFGEHSSIEPYLFICHTFVIGGNLRSGKNDKDQHGDNTTAGRNDNCRSIHVVGAFRASIGVRRLAPECAKVSDD
jgi:hypothetical protein